MFDDDDFVTVFFLCDQGIEATAVGTFVAIRYCVVCDHLNLPLFLKAITLRYKDIKWLLICDVTMKIINILHPQKLRKPLHSLAGATVME